MDWRNAGLVNTLFSYCSLFLAGVASVHRRLDFLRSEQLSKVLTVGQLSEN